jgi:NAD-dependent SIR2 family protein deacetylase
MSRTIEQRLDDKLDKDIHDHCEPRQEQETVECAKCYKIVPENETFIDFEDELGGPTCRECTKILMEGD